MDWKIENELLTKEFEFNNFTEAIQFVNNILPLAEQMNHHPDILIHSYKKVKIMLYTHSEKKITEKDHSLAKKIDQLNTLNTY
jgi:4a-hydroxytetrahydrobiopterin dehydratase